MKKYYVYLDGICGTELIGSGTLEQCKQIKMNKDKDWQPGFMWEVIIKDHKKNEKNYWD